MEDDELIKIAASKIEAIWHGGQVSRERGRMILPVLEELVMHVKQQQKDNTHEADHARDGEQ